jgi:uncharacterized protein YbjQ (UPF0145 family)
MGVLAVGSLVVLAASACTTHRAHIKYTAYQEDMRVDAQPVAGQALGKVQAGEGGAVWADCSKNADYAVKNLIAEAKARGANAIGEVRWSASNSSEPACEKGWGWVALWPFLLTPVFMSADVEATAYRVAQPAAGAGVYMLPKGADEERAFVTMMISLRE